ncbi:unnamed protein product, partial [Nesidiocoris tenuis]
MNLLHAGPNARTFVIRAGSENPANPSDDVCVVGGLGGQTDTGDPTRSGRPEIIISTR